MLKQYLENRVQNSSRKSYLKIGCDVYGGGE